MKRVFSTIKAALLCGAIVLGLSACGGSDSPSTTATATVGKDASWANLTVAANNQKVTVSWDKPGSTLTTNSSSTTPTSTYNIYYSTNITTANKKDGTKVENITSPFVHSGLTNGTTYYYVVTEVTSAGEGTESHLASATPQAAVPAPPSGMKITAKDAEIDIVFDTTAPKPTGTTSLRYNVYWSTSADLTKVNGNKISNVMISDINVFTHLSLTNGTTYYYGLTVEVNGIESAMSNILMATPMKAVDAVDTTATDPGKFGSPTDLAIDAGNGQAIISWTDAALPTGAGIDAAYSSTPVYTLYSATKSDFSDAVKTVNVATGYKLTGLTNTKRYYFKVTAGVQKLNSTDPVQNQVNSAIISAVPEAKTPTVPSGITATRGNQLVSLSWSKDKSGIPATVIGGVSYSIYFSTTAPTSAEALKQAASLAGTKISNVTGNSYDHTGLTPGKTYYYVVTAVGEGESTPSSIASVTL